MAQKPVSQWGPAYGIDSKDYDVFDRDLVSRGLLISLEEEYGFGVTEDGWSAFADTFIEIDRGTSQVGVSLVLYKLTKGFIRYNVFQYGAIFYYVPWFIIYLSNIVSCDEPPI